MAGEKASPSPRNYFLNERHELARGEKTGGGRTPAYLGINWRSKGAGISRSLVQFRSRVAQMADPIRGSRYFVLARPENQLVKKSEDKRVVGGQKIEKVSYAEKDSRVFGRLGLDLIQVNKDGTATVHARPDRIEQLVHSAAMLDSFGAREKARWATIDSFDVIPSSYMYDEDWFDELAKGELIDAVVELQPLLSGVESDQVFRALGEAIRRGRGERFRGAGTDFSGRRWIRATLLRESLPSIAKSFFSIQAIHPPQEAIVLASPTQGRTVGSGTLTAAVPNPKGLPCVAVVDTGVPSEHKFLAPYLRGKYVAPSTGAPYLGGHGSFVSSRVVFGDVDCSQAQPSGLEPACSVYDVNVGLTPEKVDEKSVLTALDAIVAVAPDVRVFNLSFDNAKPLDGELPIARLEKLRLVQDLDNFIFARDVIVVVAAGNSRPGIIPTAPYPRHFQDPNWALGTWPRSFNSLTCGSFVRFLHSDGVAQEEGAPSPFTKAGPGICGSPKPDLAEHGGNGNSAYGFQPGLGVGGCSEAGFWEDRSGSSFAAPLLARQAAITLQLLQRFCAPGTRPFAVTAKAYLILTAESPELSSSLRELAEVTLGNGQASSRLLERPPPDRAIFLWQGIIEAPGDVVRIQLPVPEEWISAAERPRVRLVVTWDPPVNSAVEDIWASRKVSAQLRPQLNGKAFASSRSGHKSYPLIDRVYKLEECMENEVCDNDSLLLELSYEQSAEYYVGIDFAPQQRVAVAAELWDDSEDPLSPQGLLQGLKVASSLDRLSVGASALRNPVVLKTRV